MTGFYMKCNTGLNWVNLVCYRARFYWYSDTAWKSDQIRSSFWSAFSCIRSEYRKIRTRKNSVFGNFFHAVWAWYVTCKRDFTLLPIFFGWVMLKLNIFFAWDLREFSTIFLLVPNHFIFAKTFLRRSNVGSLSE